MSMQDGALSGEEPPEPSPQMAERLVQMMGAGQQPQAQTWRPACVSCLNGHKVAIADLTKKLNGQGLQIGDPQFMEAINQARQVGMMLAQNPMAAQGLNGARPDVIPPIRGADTLVNGNAVCMICFQPQKQTSLLIAPGSWTPGG